MSAARTLGAIYLATASVFGLAIALNQHPDWRDSVGVAGHRLARFASAHIMKPAAHAGARLAELAVARLVEPAAHAGKRELVAFFDAIDPPQHNAHAPSVPEVARLASVSSAHRSAQNAVSTLEREIAIDQLLAAKAGAAAHENEPKRNVLADGDLAAPQLPDIEAAAPTPDQAGPAVVATARPSLPRAPELHLAPAEPPAPQIPNFASPAPLTAPSEAELARVIEHLKQNLTSEMLANFGLFLYVSKANAGPLAQRMYVFDKDASGDLTLKYDWPVSTGRERIEFNAGGARLPTFTPQGYYELDPNRIYRHYTSSQWGQPMPYAMFFNWIKNGEKTGLAIHAASGPDIAMLGRRASAGCIHISPENARVLFTLIREHYRGLTPRFAYDRRTGTMSNDGILLHDPNGHLQMADGYKVLVFIENYGGDQNVVAALY